jgi:hypothetical protein
MGKDSSPARRRGSSAGKGRRPSAKDSEKLPTWDDDALPSSRDPQSRSAYGELLTRYDGLPDRVKHKLIKSEIDGKARAIRLSDIVPSDGLKLQVSGELYDELQGELDKVPEYTSLAFMRVLMKSRKLPMSTRIAVAKEMLPYEHSKHPEPVSPTGGRSVLVVPGVVSIADWEKQAAEHRERTKAMEREVEDGME